MTDYAIAVPEGGYASVSPAEVEQSCLKKQTLNEVDFNLEEEEESRQSESEDSEDKYYGDGGGDVDLDVDEDEDEVHDGDDDVEDPYDFTQEEYERYSEQIRESEGFHVEEFPNKRLGGMIKPIVNFDEGTAIFEKVNKSSLLAIASYNYDHGTGYQVVKVVRLNVQLVGGFMYFMTIEAKDAADAANAADGDQSSRIFEAKVFYGIGHNIKVQFCRLKVFAGHRSCDDRNMLYHGDQGSMHHC